MSEKVNVGIVGCGNISGIYFKRCSAFNILNIAACADLNLDRAKAKAEEYGIPKACATAELMADPDIDIVLNLTIPHAHYPVAKAALEAGKSVYNEKPLAITRADGQALLDMAAERGLYVGNAPDTFLGGGHQTCRKLIDDGWIGEPVAATAFMMCHGHESWHPDPEFYYQVGGGPMFDMGPYYLTALVNMIGPVKRVTGSAQKSFDQRLITSAPKKGKTVDVEVPTHIAGVMDFANGAVGTIITSFDVWRANLPRIEVYGTEGSLSVPDPNGFGGPVKLMRPGQDWQEILLTHGYAENSRGLGVADMASAILSKRANRAGGQLALHVLDIMHAFHDASREGRHIDLTTTCERPAALPMNLREGEID
ncbi:MAG: Gfo/Idh/MocA family oxidoreductase [Lentisphaeria bacterium]|nr:Gfo/Idh/MocA family oxidoreductase [Lentisphaeria bacterium]